MMSGVDSDDFDAVFFTGYHAWASCPGNPLSHTMNLRNEYVELNGVRMSEFLMNTYTAWYYGVPVTFLSGDKDLCDFARELIPGITTVPVNQGFGGGVVSIHPDKAVQLIGDGAKAAAKAGKNASPPSPPTLTPWCASRSISTPTPSPSTPARNWRRARPSASAATIGSRCSASTTLS